MRLQSEWTGEVTHENGAPYGECPGHFTVLDHGEDTMQKMLERFADAGRRVCVTLIVEDVDDDT